MRYSIVDVEGEIKELETAIVWNPSATNLILWRIEQMIDEMPKALNDWRVLGVICEISQLLKNIVDSDNCKNLKIAIFKRKVERIRESQKTRLSFIFGFQFHLTSPSFSPNFPHHKPKRPEYSGLFFLIHLFFYLYPFQKQDLFS